MRYRKTKAHERHKLAVQQAYDFAVMLCYAVPHLSTDLNAADENAPAHLTPHYFAPLNSVKFLRDNVATFEERLSAYMLLSLFSFFEAFVDEIVQEFFDFHGGTEKIIELAASRDSTLAAAAESQNLKKSISRLTKNKKGKHQKYQKYSKVLREAGYRFPTERFSSYGVRALIDRYNNLKAYAIPDFIEHGFSMPWSTAERAQFKQIREKRNDVAHGHPKSVNLAYISRVNEFLRDMTFRINAHFLEHFFVVEEYAYLNPTAR
jgi:RiboL-PSP-HEPN